MVTPGNHLLSVMSTQQEGDINTMGINVNNEMTIVYLTADEIVADDDFNIRKTYNDEAIEALSLDIEKSGQINPLLVRKEKKGGGYFLLAGFKRYKAIKLINKRRKEAAKEKGKEFEPFRIFARIAPTTNEIDEVVLNAKENLMREDITPYETSSAAMRLKELLDDDNGRGGGTKAAKRLGLNVNYVNNLIRYRTKVIPEVIDAWADPGHKHANVINTALLGDLAGMDEEAQRELWARKTSGNESAEGDEGGEGEGKGGKGEADPNKPRRPSTSVLDKALAALSESGESAEWQKGASEALRFALGERKTLGKFNPAKKAKKADDDEKRADA